MQYVFKKIKLGASFRLKSTLDAMKNKVKASNHIFQSTSIVTPFPVVTFPKLELKLSFSKIVTIALL